MIERLGVLSSWQGQAAMYRPSETRRPLSADANSLALG
jgi:hypothetical protein